ncbi:hypothetical protein NM688_g6870 [Phlebia brevispora]|uniref:Uncharacterized protein n=1 Tax=Phlebia brevispora TaxID=194682 RepID=A0ACC1SBR3_9APHY|nr:hypothetical protein NM688_g6870 [Phlebia brevispora]
MTNHPPDTEKRLRRQVLRMSTQINTLHRTIRHILLDCDRHADRVRRFKLYWLHERRWRQHRESQLVCAEEQGDTPPFVIRSRTVTPIPPDTDSEAYGTDGFEPYDSSQTGNGGGPSCLLVGQKQARSPSVETGHERSASSARIDLDDRTRPVGPRASLTRTANVSAVLVLIGLLFVNLHWTQITFFWSNIQGYISHRLGRHFGTSSETLIDLASSHGNCLDSLSALSLFEGNPYPRDEYVHYSKIVEIVDELLQRRLNDLLQPPPGTTQRDFALQTDGAAVDCSLTSHCHLWPMSLLHSSPSLAISDSGCIGDCWSIPAASGQLAIVLPTPIRPTSVTVDHIPTQLAADIGRAPRMMILWGLLDGEENLARWKDNRDPYGPLLSTRDGPPHPSRYSYAPLSVMEFNIYDRSHVQTFPVFDYVQMAKLNFGIVVLEILNNWGSASNSPQGLEEDISMGDGRPRSVPVIDTRHDPSSLRPSSVPARQVHMPETVHDNELNALHDANPTDTSNHPTIPRVPTDATLSSTQQTNTAEVPNLRHGRFPSPPPMAGVKRGMRTKAAFDMENTKASKTEDREHAPALVLRETQRVRPLQRMAQVRT